MLLFAILPLVRLGGCLGCQMKTGRMAALYPPRLWFQKLAKLLLFVSGCISLIA
jgi:hypothetical protein